MLLLCICLTASVIQLVPNPAQVSPSSLRRPFTPGCLLDGVPGVSVRAAALGRPGSVRCMNPRSALGDCAWHSSLLLSSLAVACCQDIVRGVSASSSSLSFALDFRLSVISFVRPVRTSSIKIMLQSLLPLFVLGLPLGASAHERGQNAKRHSDLARRAPGDVQRFSKRVSNARMTYYEVGL